MNKWEKASNFLSIELNKLMIFHFAEERQLLQELVERATPMKVKEINVCPYCDKKIDNEINFLVVEYPFCRHCGQKLIRSDAK